MKSPRILYVSPHPLESTGGSDLESLQIDKIDSYAVNNARDAINQLRNGSYCGVFMRDTELPNKDPVEDWTQANAHSVAKYAKGLKLPLVLMVLDKEPDEQHFKERFGADLVLPWAAPYTDWKDEAIALFTRQGK